MDRKSVIRNLEYNKTWVKNPSGEYPVFTAQNILIGCIQLVNQCGRSIKSWLDRSDRRKTLTNIRRLTHKGRQVLTDLIDFTISEVLAAEWVESFWVGALPIRQTYRRSEAHIEALQAGRKRAKRQLQEAREARLAV